jgi:eukaryotic-like serine/threonine-protein kinase
MPFVANKDDLTVLAEISRSMFVRVDKVRWRDQVVLAKRLLEPKDRSLRERFEREGDVSARLDHPNLVGLLWRAPGLLLYEFVEGQTLADHLAGQVLPLPAALRIARALVGALAYAHTRGVIHLDLKPANLVLEHGGRLRLIDFGCAKDLTLEAITQLDARLGTPHYMAPEQFKGERRDPRSDLYSAGAVLYEMLAARPPYAHNPFGWLAGRPVEPPPWPAGEIGVLVAKALSREPSQRFNSALEMLIALEALD